MLLNVLWIAIGGALGALARYGLAALVHFHTGQKFPWGTLVVNLAGSLVLGIGWALAEQRLVGTAVRMSVFVGFLGAFTTFSTYMLETTQLMRDGNWWSAGANLLVSTVGGLGLFIAAAMVTRWAVA